MIWKVKSNLTPTERAKAWRLKNKAKVKSYYKKWRKENPDKFYKAIKKYQAKNPMSIKLAQKKYYLENKDKVQGIINKYNREYFSTTIEGNFLNRCIARRKSAKKKYSHFTEHKHDIDKYTFGELLEKQNGICPLTGVSLILTDRNTGKDYFIYEIDHIIPCNQPGSYHGKDNIQLVFPYSNAIKSNKG